jgi:hypothetical protein
VTSGNSVAASRHATVHVVGESVGESMNGNASDASPSGASSVEPSSFGRHAPESVATAWSTQAESVVKDESIGAPIRTSGGSVAASTVTGADDSSEGVAWA